MKSFHLLQSLNSYLQELVGGPLMIAAVLLTGCYLLCVSSGRSCAFYFHAAATLSLLQVSRAAGRRYQFFQALTTALAATIGTGNIAV